MKIRLIALLAVVALSVMAVPASAHPGVGAFTGTATVTPLGLPGLHDAVTDGEWSLVANVTGVPQSGLLTASGDLHANAAGLGAWCGLSGGSGGEGDFGDDDLSNLAWATSAGSVLPVTGDFSGDGGSGTVVAVVVAQGGVPCTSGSASSFTVAGTAALLPA